MNPHQNTWTGDNATTTKKVNSVNNTCNSCGRNSIHTYCSCLWP